MKASGPSELLQRGALAHQQRQLGEAEALYRHALALEPQAADALLLLGSLCCETGRAEEGARHLEAATKAAPQRPQVHAALGGALLSLGRLDAAVRAYATSLSLDPRQPGTLQSLGHALTRLGLVSDAIDCLTQAQRLAPEAAEIAANLGNALKAVGGLAEPMAMYRRALALDPQLSGARSNLLLALQYDADLAPAEVLREHRAWDEAHGTPRTGTLPPVAPAPLCGRKLRVGYLSPDLRDHSVAFFLEPVLAAHDRERLAIVCYSCGGRPDAVTARLARLVGPGFCDVRALGDAELAARIRADRIDLLVDLAGHTEGHRLGVFARRPAPLQLTWLGYPDTTGIAAIDYRIVDAITDPPGAEERCSERLLRLDGGFLCYRPPDGAPEPGPLPAGERDPITFGSFNQLAKLTPQTVALWSQVLLRTPGSRLLLKARGLADPAVRAGVERRFQARGIDASRLELLGQLPGQREHLAAYGRVDLALDPSPYNGTTTTCEALWMGVPVVTAPGLRHASRVGASLLLHLGLPELVADGDAAFVDLACALAADRPRLSALRASLRERLRASRLLDARAFTAALEAAYFDAWASACSEEKA
jgi:protein O-GlcNAc transferase